MRASHERQARCRVWHVLDNITDDPFRAHHKGEIVEETTIILFLEAARGLASLSLSLFSLHIWTYIKNDSFCMETSQGSNLVNMQDVLL